MVFVIFCVNVTLKPLFMNKSEIINETILFYHNDPTKRSLYRGNCHYYNHETGNMCAIGRCMADPEYFQDTYGFTRISAIDEKNRESQLLPTEVKILIFGKHSKIFMIEVIILTKVV